MSISRRTLLGASVLLAVAPVSFAAQQKTIVVGVTSGPHAEIMEVVKKAADQAGFTIKIVEFSDFVQPNAALAAGDLDLNSFQHQPYLDQQNKDRGYNLVSVAKTVTFPLTFYSKKSYKTLADLPKKARVAIPNDPTNGGRALHMLADQGLIRLRDGVGHTATVLDIVENPKSIQVVELEAPQLPLSLKDVDAAAINGSYAQPAGLDPKRDGIYTERADGPYANILVVRETDKDQPWVKEFVKLYQTPEVKAFIEKRFNGNMICAW